MKNFFVLILFLIYLSSGFLHAYTRDKGISGSLAFLYLDENYVITDSANRQKKFTQEYDLKYQGNIYNPNLLEYRLSGLIRFDDTKQEAETDSYKTDETSEDFGIDANFIKKSNFPFRVYYRTSNRPTSQIYSNTVINLLSKKENYGLSGRVKLNKFNLTYEASKDSTLEDDAGALQETKMMHYGSSLEYRNKKDTANLRYMHTETDNASFANNEKSFTSEKNDNIDFSYSSKITNDLTYSSRASYITTTSNDATIMNAQFGLNWRPKKDYSANADIALSRSDFYYAEDSNSSEAVLYRTDTLDINQNFSYKLMKDLTFTQSANFFTDKGKTSSGETASLQLGLNHRYRYQLTAQRRLNIASSFRTVIRTNKRTSLNESVSESTKETDHQYNFNSKARITEQFPSIKSNLIASVGYNGIRSSTEVTNQYTAALSLSSRFGVFTNSFNTRYMNDGNSVNIEYGDKIDYTTRLGPKGSLNASVGVQIRKYMYDEGDNRSSELYNAKLNFRYLFFNKLHFSTSMNIDKDLGYDTLKYSYDTELTIRRGLTEASILYNYDYSKILETYSNRETLQVKFKRRF
jgi:hypothetical protein